MKNKIFYGFVGLIGLVFIYGIYERYFEKYFKPKTAFEYTIGEIKKSEELKKELNNEGFSHWVGRVEEAPNKFDTMIVSDYNDYLWQKFEKERDSLRTFRENAIDIKLLSKKEKDYDNMGIKILITNKSKERIKGFKAVFTFMDMYKKELAKYSYPFEGDLLPGASETKTINYKIDNRNQQLLARYELKNIKMFTYIEVIALYNGKIIKTDYHESFKF